MRKTLWVIALAAGIGLVGCSNAELENEFAQAQERIAEMEKALDEVRLGQPGLIHSVFFWLKEGVSDEDRAAFIEGCKELGEIESVQSLYVGPPASTPARDVVDHTFDVALIVHFENREAHDIYQDAAGHQDFIEKYGDLWERVLVYDNDVE